jgi:hypothetical protein
VLHERGKTNKRGQREGKKHKRSELVDCLRESVGQDISKVARDMNRGERQGYLERVDRVDNGR